MFKCLRGSKKWRTACAWSAIALSTLSAKSPGQSYSALRTFEGNAYPEDVGWELLSVGANEGQRSLENGWLIHTMRAGDPQVFYRMNIGFVAGPWGFFLEWRAVTDYPAWLIDEWQNPAGVSAAGQGGGCIIRC